MIKKKMLVFALFCLFLLSLAACDNTFYRGTVISTDSERTQLYVGNYDGGLGHAWLDEVITAFEVVYPEVQVIVNNEKDLYSDSNLLSNMQNYTNDVYFLNGITYSNFVAQNRLAEITDIVTKTIDTEERSILDKMNPTLADYYQTSSGKYYAVPFFDAIFGLVYDVDLFEEEGFYFNSNGLMIAFDDDNTTLSSGPNGIIGDYDDGLPATYAQWQTLVRNMKLFGISPYIWTGYYDYYRMRYLTSIWADYEGKDNFDLNFSFAGEYQFSGDSVMTPINIQNGYRLQEQRGKLYALTFAEEIIKSGLYTPNSFDTVNTHTMAQQEFLLSAVTSNRIAMIVEGGWWENEARSFFNTMAKNYGEEYGFGERRFGFMPVPKADDGSSSERTTLVSSTGNSVVCISERTPNLQIAKNFVEFVHRDTSLRTFSRMTGAIRPYDYQLEASDLSEMSHYAKNMFEIYSSDTTDISYVTLYYHDAFVKHRAFLGTNWWWRTNIGGVYYTDPFYELSQNASLTANQYFNGLQLSFSKARWDTEMSEYYPN